MRVQPLVDPICLQAAAIDLTIGLFPHHPRPEPGIGNLCELVLEWTSQRADETFLSLYGWQLVLLLQCLAGHALVEPAVCITVP